MRLVDFKLYDMCSLRINKRNRGDELRDEVGGIRAIYLI